jgi:hypothetical protein
MQMASDAQFTWSANISTISAEDIIGQVPPLWPKQQFIKRVALEAKGMADWDKGEYSAQDKAQSEWLGELLST